MSHRTANKTLDSNDEERGRQHVSGRTPLARSSSSVSFSFGNKMKTFFLIATLMPLIAIAQESPRWLEIKAFLAEKRDWKIIDSKTADKAVFDAVLAYSPKGISAYWSWGLRDALILPNDLDGVGLQGDVLWIGQLNDMLDGLGKSQPRALFLINARTGKTFTNGKPTENQ